MTQQTFVGHPDPKQAKPLMAKLEAEGFTPRSIPYSIFSFSGKNLTITLYNSGKLVVQGMDAENFGRELLGISAPVMQDADGELIGTDESGKGDYFGPLTVAAVFIPQSMRAQVKAGEIDDSKKLSDTTIKRLAAAIQKQFPNTVILLNPKEYNAEYQKSGNLNRLLAGLHARAILELSKKTKCRKVLTDQFGDASLIPSALGAEAKLFDLHQRPRAESDPAVAAASILAREAFVAGMSKLSDQAGVDLPLGAGEDVDRAARKIANVHGRAGLGNFAKLHFKNTQKLDGLF